MINAKEELYSHFYSFTYSRAIRMHFNSHRNYVLD